MQLDVNVGYGFHVRTNETRSYSTCKSYLSDLTRRREFWRHRWNSVFLWSLGWSFVLLVPQRARSIQFYVGALQLTRTYVRILTIFISMARSYRWCTVVVHVIVCVITYCLCVFKLWSPMYEGVSNKFCPRVFSRCAPQVLPPGV